MYSSFHKSMLFLYACKILCGSDFALPRKVCGKAKISVNREINNFFFIHATELYKSKSFMSFIVMDIICVKPVNQHFSEHYSNDNSLQPLYIDSVTYDTSEYKICLLEKQLSLFITIHCFTELLSLQMSTMQ